MLKLPKKATPVVFSFYMAAIVAAVMSLALTAVNSGIGDGYVGRAFSAYSIGFPVAFISVLIVRPIVIKLVSITVVK